MLYLSIFGINVFFLLENIKQQIKEDFQQSSPCDLIWLRKALTVESPLPETIGNVGGGGSGI